MIINFKVSVQVLPQMAPPCLSKTWQTIYRWIPCLDHFSLVPGQRNKL